MDQGQNTNGIYSAPRPDFQSVRPVGDIVLTPGVEKKKSKLPWIVAGVTAVIVVALVIIAIVVSRNAGSHGSIVTVADKYMNYLNGSEGGKKVKDVYYADAEDMTREAKIEYFEGAKVILDELIVEFDGKYPGQDNTNASEKDGDNNSQNEVSVDELKRKLKNNRSQLSAIIEFFKTDYTNGDIMIGQYLSGTSLGNIKKTTENNYTNMQKTGDGNAEMYAKIQSGIYENVVEIIDIYASADCIKDGVIADNCKLDTEKSGKINSLFAENNSGEAEKTELINDFFTSYFETARSIYNTIKDEGAR